MSIFPAVLGVIALLLLTLFYPLNEKRMSEIAAELKIRRAADAATTASV
jgi:Na+/melibiose symporter-like transporter